MKVSQAVVEQPFRPSAVQPRKALMPMHESPETYQLVEIVAEFGLQCLEHHFPMLARPSADGRANVVTITIVQLCEHVVVWAGKFDLSHHQLLHFAFPLARLMRPVLEIQEERCSEHVGLEASVLSGQGCVIVAIVRNAGEPIQPHAQRIPKEVETSSHCRTAVSEH